MPRSRVEYLGQVLRQTIVSLGVEGITERRLFGGPAFYVEDQLIAAVLERKLVVRAKPATIAAFIENGQAAIFSPKPGQRLTNCAVVLEPDSAPLSAWLQQAMADNQLP